MARRLVETFSRSPLAPCPTCSECILARLWHQNTKWIEELTPEQEPVLETSHLCKDAEGQNLLTE